jgi:hypothetical protein
VVNGRDGRAEWDGVGSAAHGFAGLPYVRAEGQRDEVREEKVPMTNLDKWQLWSLAFMLASGYALAFATGWFCACCHCCITMLEACR